MRLLAAILALSLAGCAAPLRRPLTFPEAPTPPTIGSAVTVADVVGEPVIAHEGVPAQFTGRLLRPEEWTAVLSLDARRRADLDAYADAWRDLLAALMRDRATCEGKEAALIEALIMARRAQWEALGVGFLGGLGTCGAGVGTVILRQ